MRVTIPHSQWSRGRGIGSGEFLDTHGRKCALGHILSALGFIDAELKGNGSIAELDATKAAQRLPPELYQFNRRLGVCYASEMTCSVTNTNDDPEITDAERASFLTMVLEPVGFDLTFIEE
jgi:hypothetical protein